MLVMFRGAAADCVIDVQWYDPREINEAEHRISTRWI